MAFDTPLSCHLGGLISVVEVKMYCEICNPLSVQYGAKNITVSE